MLFVAGKVPTFYYIFSLLSTLVFQQFFFIHIFSSSPVKILTPARYIFQPVSQRNVCERKVFCKINYFLQVQSRTVITNNSIESWKSNSITAAIYAECSRQLMGSRGDSPSEKRGRRRHSLWFCFPEMLILKARFNRNPWLFWEYKHNWKLLEAEETFCEGWRSMFKVKLLRRVSRNAVNPLFTALASGI